MKWIYIQLVSNQQFIKKSVESSFLNNNDKKTHMDRVLQNVLYAILVTYWPKLAGYSRWRLLPSAMQLLTGTVKLCLGKAVVLNRCSCSRAVAAATWLLYWIRSIGLFLNEIYTFVCYEGSRLRVNKYTDPFCIKILIFLTHWKLVGMRGCAAGEIFILLWQRNNYKNSLVAWWQFETRQPAENFGQLRHYSDADSDTILPTMIWL